MEEEDVGIEEGEGGNGNCSGRPRGAGADEEVETWEENCWRLGCLAFAGEANEQGALRLVEGEVLLKGETVSLEEEMSLDLLDWTDGII